ncbi:hypothetical protein RvY_08949 [Ramazzottius varieornatus]|uniref:Cation-transporting P-type ATPase C-terminal domain-containing protein n=1 Tax=Ramazzottius varieornatus TaxID=947166 RepID=A0A1D1VGU5_RAMVA|nr:hypothetical protein RvY_08949 [Ramazzottius varieornatus]
MLLYSIVQFIALLILYQQWTLLLDMHFLYVDMLITSIVALLMGCTRANMTLVPTRPHGSLMAPIVLISTAAHMIVVIAFQTMIILCLHRQSWYVPIRKYEGPEDHERVTSWESTVLFIAAAFQDLILAFVFSKGAPYRRPVYTNVMFLGALVGLSALTVWVFLYPPLWLSESLQVMYDPLNPRWSFRLLVLALLACNFLVAFTLEEFMFDRVWFKRVVKTVRRKKHSRSAFKMVERQISHSLMDWPPIGQTTYAKSDDSSSNATSVDSTQRPESTYL